MACRERDEPAHSKSSGHFAALSGFLLLTLVLPAAAQTWPNITVEPVNQSVCPNGNATFYVEAVGDPPLNFQWRRDGLPIFDGLSYGIATTQFSSWLTVSNVQHLDTNSTFDVLVANTNGVTESDPVRVTVGDLLISQQPTNTVFVFGGPLVLRVEACSASSPAIYQWFFNDAPLTDSPGHILGAQQPQLNIQNATQLDEGLYHVVVGNFSGSVTSAVVRCSVATPPLVVTPPQPQTVCWDGNGEAVFSVAASGSLPLSFFWFRDNNPVPDGVTSGPTNSSLLAANVLPNEMFYVVVSDANGQATSTPPVAAQGNDPAIRHQPTNTVVTNGGTIRFQVEMCNEFPQPAYQWYKGHPPVQLINGGRIFGANSSQLNIANAQSADAGDYRVVITQPWGSVTSITVQCSIVSPPSVGDLPSRIVRFRTGTLFGPTYTGTPPLFYRWFRNDILIPGAVNPTLTLNNIQRPQVGVYHVVVGNPWGFAQSAKAHLQVRLTLESTTPIFREEATDERFSLTNAVPVGFAPPPTAVFHGVPLLFTTYSATTSAGDSNICLPSPSHTMWVLYTAPTTNVTRFSTEGSDFDTVLSVYTWDGIASNPPKLVKCDDNGGYDHKASALSFSPTNGQNYYIMVDGAGGATGTVRLQVGENIRKVRLDPSNHSFRFEWAGTYWYENRLISTTDLSLPSSNWITITNVPPLCRDWVLGYTNLFPINAAQFYSTTVNTTNTPTCP